MIKTELVNKKDWVELKAYGISVGPLQSRPVLLLKNEDLGVTLPVWMLPHQVVESVAGADATNIPSGPHSITERIFKSLDLLFVGLLSLYEGKYILNKLITKSRVLCEKNLNESTIYISLQFKKILEKLLWP